MLSQGGEYDFQTYQVGRVTRVNIQRPSYDPALATDGPSVCGTIGDAIGVMLAVGVGLPIVGIVLYAALACLFGIGGLSNYSARLLFYAWVGLTILSGILAVQHNLPDPDSTDCPTTFEAPKTESHPRWP